MKLYKYKCKGCEIEIPVSDERLKKCEDCGSTLLEEIPLGPEDYLTFIEVELKSANHHDYVELPEKLYKRIIKWSDMDGTCKTEIAQIICEEFYKNI